jgi:hypothetical protein
MNIKNRHIRESRERQLSGEDYQQVAHDIWCGVPNATEEDYDALCESPEPGCDSVFAP